MYVCMHVCVLYYHSSHEWNGHTLSYTTLIHAIFHTPHSRIHCAKLSHTLSLTPSYSPPLPSTLSLTPSLTQHPLIHAIFHTCITSPATNGMVTPNSLIFSLEVSSIRLLPNLLEREYIHIHTYI